MSSTRGWSRWLDALGAERHLPERIRRLIAAKEAESERLIGWVQLAVVTAFGTLYFLAPRPADAGMPMYEPVPIALTAYAFFTIGRLALAYRGWMPGWLILLSILTDVALLIGLTWSFHDQYHQPAAFSLKVPTFVYFFIFIATRALRFDPRYVLFTGLAAALGWGLMLVAAIRASDPDVITRSFVAYVNGNHILRGAEFDKIFTILMVTALLTLAIFRARQTLLTAVTEETHSREIRRFLSEGVAEAITTSERLVEAGQAAERDAAVIMLDIRGFTRLSTRLEPSQVVALLTGFHARVIPVLERNGGVVDKFLGDGVMATFGAVTPSSSAAADALKALGEIMDEAEAWSGERAEDPASGPLEVNGAVAAGPVVFATLGSADRLEYTVIGEAVNLAAKLEKHNKVEGTRALASAETVRLALEQGFMPRERLLPRKGVTVAGVPQTIDLMVVRA
ncbi:MAG: adenylate/guanylate cyclase domain-containing protein [Hyphomicrobiaceae bacterium]